MATKTEEFLTGTGTTISFTTQYINESDIKVRVDGGAPLTFIGTTGTPTTGQYKIAANSTTITFGDNQNGKSLHIYSETDVTSPTVTFTPGSSIKAADLNALETLVRHGIQESRNDIIEQDLRDGQVTSNKILGKVPFFRSDKIKSKVLFLIPNFLTAKCNIKTWSGFFKSKSPSRITSTSTSSE